MRDCPAHLYKYRDLAGSGLAHLERTLLHDEIFMAGPDTFNDPFDCLPTFDLSGTVEQLAEMFKRVIDNKAPHVSDSERARLARSLAENPVVDLQSETARMDLQALHERTIRKSIGVYCLCEAPDNLLMWSHYGGSHSGICLQFDSDQPPFNVALDVDYTDSREPVNRLTESADRSMQKALLTKFRGWDYEREWRVVDYEKGSGALTFPATALTGVVFGCRLSSDNESSIRQWIRERPTPLSLFRTRVSNSEFKLYVDQVE